MSSNVTVPRPSEVGSWVALHHVAADSGPTELALLEAENGGSTIGRFERVHPALDRSKVVIGDNDGVRSRERLEFDRRTVRHRTDQLTVQVDHERDHGSGQGLLPVEDDAARLREFPVIPSPLLREEGVLTIVAREAEAQIV